MNLTRKEKYTVIACGLCLFLALAGCEKYAPLKEQFTAERMFFKAGKLDQRVMLNPRIASVSDYDAALDGYEGLWTRFPDNTTNDVIERLKKQSLVRISALWTLRGEIQKAVATYDRFLAHYPQDQSFGAFIHFANAKGNERIFNIEKAISEYEALVSNFGEIEDPFKPKSNLMSLPLKIARLKRSSHRNSNTNSYGEAVAYYDTVMTKWPKSPAAFMAAYYKASVDADQGRWPAVIKTLSRLAKEYPDREEIPNILLSLGNIYLDGLNQPREAKIIFARLLRQFKDKPVAGYAVLGTARVLLRAKRVKKGRARLRSIVSDYPENRTLCASSQLTLATSYEKEGDWERALIEYHWVQERYPLTFQGFYVPTYVAEYYRRQGDLSLAKTAFDRAIEHYRHLIKKYPQTVLAGTAQEYVIYCLSVQKKWDDAAEAAVSLRNIVPGSYADISSFLFLGQIYERSNQLQKAIEIYEKFTLEFPNHPVTSEIQKKIAKMRKRI